MVFMVFMVHDQENPAMIRPLERGPDRSLGKTDPSFLEGKLARES